MKVTFCRLRGVPSLSVGVALFGLVSAGPALAGGQGEPGATFTKDIAPILQRSCQSCHRPGAMAPMSLLTYEEVRPWASAIKRRTSPREMPPWFIERNVGIQKFKDDPSLSDAEIAKIARWVDSGAPRGNPADTPPPRQFPAGADWSFGDAGSGRLVAGPDDQGGRGRLAGRHRGDADRSDRGSLRQGRRGPRSAAERESRRRGRRHAAGGAQHLGDSPRHDRRADRLRSEQRVPDERVRQRRRSTWSTSWGRTPRSIPTISASLLPANSVLTWRMHTHSNGKETQVRIDLGFKLHPKGYKPKHVLMAAGGAGEQRPRHPGR